MALDLKILYCLPLDDVDEWTALAYAGSARLAELASRLLVILRPATRRDMVASEALWRTWICPSSMTSIIDSLPYYDNDLELYPSLRAKVDRELAREPKAPQELHEKVPPPIELFTVSITLGIFVHV